MPLMQYFKDFFNFNKRQERGVLVLSSILIIVILLSYYAPECASPPENIQVNKEYLQQLQLLAMEDNKKVFSNNKIKNKESAIIEINSYFDPNTISKEKLLDIGLSDFVSNNIIKYRTNGGRFYISEDLSKIYGMKPEWYDVLAPYIKINQIEKAEKKWNKPSKKRAQIENTVVEDKEEVNLGINSADSVDLLKVGGIGPFYAGSIIKHRERLGGYTSVYQLLDLYNMDSTRLFEIVDQLFVDSVAITKININEVSFKSLLKHPYIDYETTKYIINKRRKLGKYAALYELRDPVYMPDDLFDKLQPYLVVN